MALLLPPDVRSAVNHFLNRRDADAGGGGVAPGGPGGDPEANDSFDLGVLDGVDASFDGAVDAGAGDGGGGDGG